MPMGMTIYCKLGQVAYGLSLAVLFILAWASALLVQLLGQCEGLNVWDG